MMLMLSSILAPPATLANTFYWPHFPTDAEIDGAFARYISQNTDDLNAPGAVIVEKTYRKMHGSFAHDDDPAYLRSALIVSFGITHPKWVDAVGRTVQEELPPRWWILGLQY